MKKARTAAASSVGRLIKYTWVDVGSSYLPSDILAGFLCAQLEARDTIQAQRQAVWEFYNAHLADWAAERSVQLPFVPDHCEQSYHMFYILMPSLAERQAMIEYLKASGIYCVFHYLPLHLSDMGKKFGGKAGDCPVTEDVSDRLLRLPFYNSLSELDLSLVTEKIKAFRFEPLSV